MLSTSLPYSGAGQGDCSDINSAEGVRKLMQNCIEYLTEYRTCGSSNCGEREEMNSAFETAIQEEQGAEPGSVLGRVL